jgi:hypothetical protein
MIVLCSLLMIAIVAIVFSSRVVPTGQKASWAHARPIGAGSELGATER